MNYDYSIFRAYDVRGVYGRDFDEEFAFELGSRVLPLFPGSQVVVGRDVRSSSPVLYEALVRGLTASGAEVVGIGDSTTPMMYWAVRHLNADGGIMVTASHNDAEYNGFKVVGHGAVPIVGKSIKEAFNRFSPTAGSLGGWSWEVDIKESYIMEILKNFSDMGSELARMNIVVDAANGAAGFLLPQLAARLNASWQQLNWQPNGSFPNHKPNPLVLEARAQAVEVVRSSGTECAVLFDGDADRIMFLDEKGELVYSDELLLVLASQYKNPVVVHDLKMSRAVSEFIGEWGGRALSCRTGHVFVKDMMRRRGAVLGGELSGHFPVASWGHSEACLWVMLKVFEILIKSDKKLSDIVAPFKRYAHSGEINFRVQDIQKAISVVGGNFTDGRISRIDGVSIEYKDWWLNVRGSNTEPILRLVVEASDNVALKQKVDDISSIIIGLNEENCIDSH